MPLLWCAISGHGFGHAAQVVPVLNELGRRDPNLRVLLRTTVPQTFFRHRLRIPWELSAQQQDIGCVQEDPLTIDVDATWQAYQSFHETFDQRVDGECEILKQHAPDLVLSNISYLALDAGRRAGIPTIAYGSISWDHVLQELADSHKPAHFHIISYIQDIYKRAEGVVRIAPFLPMDAFPRHYDVGPVGHAPTGNSQEVGRQLFKDSTGPLVLVALGGVPLHVLPFERLDQLAPYQFLLDLDLSGRFARLTSTHEVGKSFMELFAASQIIVSKPGYGTVIEAVAERKPFVYVRRYNFPDEGPLVDYAHRYGRAIELSKEDFYSGDWGEALAAVQSIPEPHESPPESGVSAAADIISSYLPA